MMNRAMLLSLAVFCAACDSDSDGGTVADTQVDATQSSDMSVTDAGMTVDMALLPDAQLPDMMLLPDAAPVPNPPEIEVATARLNAIDNGLGLIINGIDLDDDVAGITIELFTPTGQLDGLRPVPPEGEPDPCGDWSSFTPTAIVCVSFDRLMQGLGNFEGIWSLGYRDGSVFERLVTMRVSVFDAAGERSQVVDARIEETPVVAEGEQCDLNRGITKCDEGFMCGAVAGGRRVCQEADPFCPDFYNMVDLNSQPNSTFSGDTTNQGSHGNGSCGGGSGDHVFAFKAVRPGDYAFRVEVDNPMVDDTVMWIRSHCQFADWRAELACNDDNPELQGDLSSNITLEMDPDETVYVFVGGYQPPDGQPGWQGAYTLSVTYQGE